MIDDDITLPPLTDEQCRDLAREVDLDWHQGFQVCEPENRYAALCRAAVLLDRQQRAAPSAEPVAWLDEEHDCAYTRAELDGGGAQGMRPLYAAPPDHTAVMRQALEALSEAVTYVESPSWSPSMADECRKAIDALRAALEPKQC
jgi:hypothetical protein